MLTVERTDFVSVPVSDLARADEFYGGTLGLARNPHASGERWVEYETGNLTLALSTFGGGIAFRVPDVEEGRRALEEEGVEFPRDTFDSGVCHGASFADPDGNRLLLHRRYAPSEPWEPPAADVERTDFIGVSVRERPKGVDFYGGTLGLRRNELAHEEWPELETGNATVLLSTPEQTRSEFRPSDYSIALRVADVGATMERLRSAGVEFGHDEVYETRVCRMAFFRDPDGNSLILHRRFAPYSDGSLP